MSDNSEQFKDPSSVFSRLAVLSRLKETIRSRNTSDTDNTPIDDLSDKEEAVTSTRCAQIQEKSNEEDSSVYGSICENVKEENGEDVNPCVPSDCLEEEYSNKYDSSSEEINQQDNRAKDSFDETLCDLWYANKFVECPTDLCDVDTDILYGNLSEESNYSDYSPEEYVEINGQYFEVSALASSVDEDLKEMENIKHSEEYSNVPEIEHYGWSCFVETDEERNQVYDKWICDIESWERNRLMWLDNVASSEGFDSSHYKDRTFLVKVERLCNESQGNFVSLNKTVPVPKEAKDLISAHEKISKQEEFRVPFPHTLAEIENVTVSLDAVPQPKIEDGTEPSMSDELFSLFLACGIQEKAVSWEEGFNYMRLQRHRVLHEMGLANCYEELLQEQSFENIENSDPGSDLEQSSEDVEVLSFSSSSDLDQMSENFKVSSDERSLSSYKEIFDHDDSVASAANSFEKNSDQSRKQENLNDAVCQIPSEDILVYQFTDRNLWCKFRKWPKPQVA